MQDNKTNHKFLMCEPTYYDVVYEINSWMDSKKHVDTKLAKLQWQALRDKIVSLGAEVEYVASKRNTPDMVFTANAALIDGENCILSNFKHRERQKEEGQFLTFFKDKYKIHKLEFKNCFEGAGDALFCNEILFCGHGFRSKKSAYVEIAKILHKRKLILLTLTNYNFYHLDTCFCPIDENKVIYYPNAFDKDSRNLIENNCEAYAINGEEAYRFSCNAVVVGKNIILPTKCPQTEKVLSNLGFNTHSVDMSEFIKAGGACKCLTLDTFCH